MPKAYEVENIRLATENRRLRRENRILRESLEHIAQRPVVERNPDGVDQAAHTMQLIAQETLDVV